MQLLVHRVSWWHRMEMTSWKHWCSMSVCTLLGDNRRLSHQWKYVCVYLGGPLSASSQFLLKSRRLLAWPLQAHLDAQSKYRLYHTSVHAIWEGIKWLFPRRNGVSFQLKDKEPMTWVDCLSGWHEWSILCGISSGGEREDRANWEGVGSFVLIRKYSWRRGIWPSLINLLKELGLSGKFK